MKEATFKDAMRIGDSLDLDFDVVWQLIKGKRYEDKVELELMVCHVISQLSPEDLDIA